MNWAKFSSRRVLAVCLMLALSACLEDDVKPLAVGVQAPAFTLELVGGGTAKMAPPYPNGRVITFMSSWCPCSNESIPLMKNTYRDYREKGIEFLLVSIQDSEGKFRKFIEKWEVPFLAGYDPGEKISRAYGVTAPPTTVFVDRDGKVRRVFYGNIKDKEKEFLQWTKELL